MAGPFPIVALIGALLPNLAVALEFADGKLHFRGFASQAAVHTSANRYFGDSPDTSFDFTEVGLNASYQANPRLLVAGQVLARRAGDMYDGSPSLDYGLVDYAAIANSRHRLGVRLGRIKNPLGLYNETRDVPFTRPGIFLPQVIYYDKSRNLLLSYDGLMLYSDLFADQGNLSLSLGAGQSVLDENVEWLFLADDTDGRLEAEGVNWAVAGIWFSTPTEDIKLGLSGAIAELKFDAGPATFLSPGNIDVSHWIASAQYNTADWTLSAEYARTPTTWNEFGPFWPFEDQVGEGYYLQGTYRLLPTVELMARYEEGYANRDDRSGRELSALTGGVTPRYDFFSKIATLGLRWDLRPNIMLRLEYQRYDGTYALSIRENPDPTELTREWDVFAASLSVRF